MLQIVQIIPHTISSVTLQIGHAVPTGLKPATPLCSGKLFPLVQEDSPPCKRLFHQQKRCQRKALDARRETLS